ncbi:MAG: NAD-dependent epimerase/dehydratase [Eubacterium sp.]|nr:NAD-dependent epimerase/dehydratase [Eubacterium sp.]
MRILLTGATGFVGSHILKALLADHHSVCILIRKYSKPDRIRDVIENCPVYSLDTAVPEQIFGENQIDCVVHCATCYGRNHREYMQNMTSNMLFPMELLCCAVDHGVKYFMNTDTFFCKQIVRESDLDRDVYMSGYTLSKMQFRQWGRVLASEYGIRFVNMKLEHVYGEDDSVGKFIPYVVNQCRNNVPVIKLSSGMQKRDFIHISDVTDAYRTVISGLQNPAENNYVEYGVGTGRMRSLKEFVELIHTAVRSSTVLDWGKVNLRPGELMQSEADNSALIKLGWHAKIMEDSDIRKVFESPGGGQETDRLFP